MTRAMTPQDAGDLIKRILGAYPTQRQRMTPADVGAMTVAYTAGLIDLPYELARDAVDRCLKSCEWIPTVARIRAEAGEIRIGARRSGGEAWGDVMRAVSTHGQYREPVFEDEITQACVAIVTWRAICTSDQIGLASCRRTFIEAYESITASSRKAAQVAQGGVAPRRLGVVGIGDAAARALGGDTRDSRPELAAAPPMTRDDERPAVNFPSNPDDDGGDDHDD